MSLNNNEEVYHLSQEEQDGVKKLREMFQGGIPSDLDTDLNLRRWIHGWKGDLKEIEPRLKSYIENRKLAKLDVPDHLEKVMDNPLVVKYFKYLAFSRELDIINSKDNCAFIVERIENVDLNNVMKVITCGDFLHMNFILCEAFQRQILKQEKKSKKPSGITIVYDMTGLKVTDFLNPNSPLMKVNKLTMSLFQDYYCDILHKIYCINAPSLFTVAWDMVKHFMNKNTQEKFIMLGHNYKEILQANIDIDILPVRFGGTKRDTTGLVNAETLCWEPAPITEKDFYVPKKVDEFQLQYIKPSASFEIRKTIDKPNSTLSWQYWVNSEVEFSVLKETSDGKKRRITPLLTYNSPKLPEEGQLTCGETGEYILEFKNNSTSWFSLKLEYAVEVY